MIIALEPREKIVKNSMQCLECFGILTSEIPSAVVRCFCGNLQLSGGHEKIEYYANIPEKVLDLSQVCTASYCNGCLRICDGREE